MSQSNHFQPWKQSRPVAIPSNLSTNNSYGKLPAVAHQHLQQPIQQQQQVHLSPGGKVVQSAVASSSTSAISSSTGSSGGTSSSSGMNDFLSQLGANKLMLSKLSASYGLPSLTGGMLSSLDQQQHSAAAGQECQQYSPADDCANDKERELRIQQIFENAIGDGSKKQIAEILEKISILRPPERLLLYLRMPGGYPETDPLRQSQNPLGTRSEINHTINWVRSHLEHDPNVSIPKQEVYDDYTAYCERIDIKPLSTADFGKVMKQVFPGIRPRRLGTRGHSRYCYAAMRKATKLAAPKLPDLSTTGNSGVKPEPEDHVPSDEEAWKVIKVWAEAMLPSAFASINELASFINKNNLNSPASIASRQLLQKKLQQRELKERKKLTAAALKKRRKKRRKTMSTSVCEVASSEPVASSSASASSLYPTRAGNENHIQQTGASTNTSTTLTVASNGASIGAAGSSSPAAPPAHNLLQRLIKHERQDFTDEDNNGGTPGVVEATGESQKLQEQQQSTNLICDTSGSAGVLGAAAAAAAAAASMARQVRSPAEEYQIFCKKVRQAQQLKAAAQSQIHNHQQGVASSPLRPPSASAKRVASMAHLTRQKRLKLLQQQQQRSLEAQNNTAPRYDDMGNLILIESQNLVTSSKEDFIIPRERVISICNMDKNALDDYLNCHEDNSQDQDQELLQYFPEENQATLTVSASGASGVESSTGSALETGGFASLFEDSDTNVKLSQLRSMLEQNMNQGVGGGIDKQQQQQQHQVGGQLDGFDGSVVGSQMSLQPGSAAASLAMLSQRHHGSGGTRSLDINNGSEGKKNSNNGNMKLTLDGFSSLGSGAANVPGNAGVPLQSPNGRRKHYSFVPISAGPTSPRIPVTKATQQSSTPNASPFVSPRNTPIHRKNKPINNNGLTLNILQQNQQSLQLSGYHPRPSYVKNEPPASAPPSPSLVQTYRFGMNPNALNCPNTLPSFQPICGPSSQMQPHQGLVSSHESRSSSVPLIPNYEGYSHSSFTSMSQTPVPSECDDFSDPNNILDMLNEPSSSSNNNAQQSSSIKLEEPPVMSDLLDHEEIFSKASSVPYNNSMSRSVPSTPLPHQMAFHQANPAGCGSLLGGSSGGGHSAKSLFDLPKSVPSTPITLNNGGEPLFQYSPETSRDFLINGNSVERGGSGKLTSYYHNQNTVAATGGSNPGGPVNGGGGGSSGAGNVSSNGVVNGGSVTQTVGAASEMSILGEGIESLTDALIGSDTLRYL